MDKLKPCPFCGSEALLFDNEATGTWYAICSISSCATESIHTSEQSGAIEAWNTRPLEEAAEARAAELERVLRMVEFSGDYPYDPCLWCNGYAKDGHAPDCPRQKVLGEKLVEG